MIVYIIENVSCFSCQKHVRIVIYCCDIYVVRLHGRLCCHGDLRLLTLSDGASP